MSDLIYTAVFPIDGPSFAVHVHRDADAFVWRDRGLECVAASVRVGYRANFHGPFRGCVERWTTNQRDIVVDVFFDQNPLRFRGVE